jgi:hypothetical protein
MAELNRPTGRLLAEAGNMVKVCAVSNLSGDCMVVPRAGVPPGGCLLGAIWGVSRLQLFPEK